MELDILGNGPSLSLFDNNKNKKDLTIACNIPIEGLDIDYTCIIDISPLKVLAKSPELLQGIPAILSSRSYEYVLREKIRIEVAGELELFKNKQISKVIPANSAHHSIFWALAQYSEIDKVNLWGIDSLWQNSTESRTHRIVNKRSDINRNSIRSIWLKYWSYVFNLYDQTEFNIMIPHGNHNSCFLNSSHNYPNISMTTII